MVFNKNKLHAFIKKLDSEKLDLFSSIFENNIYYQELKYWKDRAQHLYSVKLNSLMETSVNQKDNIQNLKKALAELPNNISSVIMARIICSKTSYSIFLAGDEILGIVETPKMNKQKLLDTSDLLFFEVNPLNSPAAE